jgi:hypothetical protein
MSDELKCLMYRISDRVIHEGVEKTIIAICLGYVQLDERPFNEIKPYQFTYGDWVDLDAITPI